MKKPALHVLIILGMILGLIYGLLASNFGWIQFTIDWIKPFGTIFINLLKLVAVPLVIVTIIGGITSLSDTTKLTRIGTKTLGWFLTISLISATVGLIFVLAISPGKYMPIEKREELRIKYADDVTDRLNVAQTVKSSGPLRVLEDIVPGNIFFASQDNRNMLQVIFFSVLFGIGMVISPSDKVTGLKNFFLGVNEVMLKMVHIIMKFDPIGVMALIASLFVDLTGNNPSEAIDLLKVLGLFAITVIAAIAFLMMVIYPILVNKLTNFKYIDFLKRMLPAQILAFSTSSSAATLPVTIDCVEKNLKLNHEISGFVLPLGITINMHGTCIHQVVSAVFIAQAFGHNLGFTEYLIVIFTCVLTSMGAPAVPGAGIILLLIVLGSLGVEAEGLALILAIDRPLDMIRTIPNVLGDAIVGSILDKSENRDIKSLSSV
uniref:dicarboxylate/amino acid:cation symporter n=1 Tax=Fulvivirga sp. TaxID=1931237 RepID=UPI00404956F3